MNKRRPTKIIVGNPPLIPIPYSLSIEERIGINRGLPTMTKMYLTQFLITSAETTLFLRHKRAEVVTFVFSKPERHW
jgi:hypothetical protein